MENSAVQFIKTAKVESEEDAVTFDQNEDYRDQLSITYCGLTPLFFILYVLEVCQVLVAGYFFYSNLLRFIELQYFVSAIWIFVCVFVFFTTALKLVVFTYLVFSFCLNTLTNKVKLNKILIRMCFLIVFVNFFFSLFYLVTDLILFAYRMNQFSEFVDLFGDVVYMVGTFLAVVLYGWISNYIFMKQIRKRTGERVFLFGGVSVNEED